MFHFNPEYKPGGVHNFWICSPASTSQDTCTPASQLSCTPGGHSGNYNLAKPTTINDISSTRKNPLNDKSMLFGMFTGGFFTSTSPERNFVIPSSKNYRDEISWNTAEQMETLAFM